MYILSKNIKLYITFQRSSDILSSLFVSSLFAVAELLKLPPFPRTGGHLVIE